MVLEQVVTTSILSWTILLNKQLNSMHLRSGGPKSTASNAFRFNFCLCRWSNIFSCI